MNPRSIRVGPKARGDRHDERARRGFEKQCGTMCEAENKLLNPLFGVC